MTITAPAPVVAPITTEPPTKFTQDVRDRWTWALRSGVYEQCALDFEHDGKFCALGVLCDVTGQPTITKWGIGNWTFVIRLLDGDPMDLRREITLMNDRGVPFPKIADWIEQNIPVQS